MALQWGGSHAQEGPDLAQTADNWIVRAPGDIDRIEACFSGAAFAPHRHDTYAVGVTLKGVQSFDYRGAARGSRPGQLVILHPDEQHDGRAGDERAFRYRAAYVAPAEVQAVLGGRALPFIEGGVSDHPGLRRAVWGLLRDISRPLSGLALQDALFDLATALQQAVGDTPPARIANREAAARALDYIEARLDESFTLDELERATGHDRWALSRDFRALYGASPYRYLVMRRLDRAREMIVRGTGLADAAHACGFADQSHFTRLFRKAFGLTPRAWLAVQGRSHNRSISESRARPS